MFPVTKALPIDDSSKQVMLQIRRTLFEESMEQLANKLYDGDISLGTFHETVKKELRGYIASMASISKGGWDVMTSEDWGRIGTPLRNEYSWLRNFVSYIDTNRSSVSRQYLINRLKSYANAGNLIANIVKIPFDVRLHFPFIPRDSSTRCLNNCKCYWEITIKFPPDNSYKIVQAVWKLSSAEHCVDCIARKDHTVIFRVPVDTVLPSYVGK